VNPDLEYELKRALRRKEPSRDLMPRQRASSWRLALAAGVAISVAAPAGWMQYRAYEDAERQRKAKDQLVFALHLAAGKLQMAQQKLRTVK
jgi:hypothetical protein